MKRYFAKSPGDSNNSRSRMIVLDGQDAIKHGMYKSNSLEWREVTDHLTGQRLMIIVIPCGIPRCLCGLSYTEASPAPETWDVSEEARTVSEVRKQTLF